MVTPASTPSRPDFAAVLSAAARIAEFVHRTPVLQSRSLDALSGAELHFKCENLQRAGAFKFRGACNAVWSLSPAEAARGVVTHSSGNHGAALALAARSRGIPANVVVPEGAARCKLVAIEAFGGILHRCAPTMVARERQAATVATATGATLVHPFTDPTVIAGQGTAALELLEAAGPLDALVAPIGGGGLIAGSAIAAHALRPELAVYAAEPADADDAALSLELGRRVSDRIPDTLCDGLRGTVGEINLRILRRHRVEVLRVDDRDTLTAMRLLSERMKLVVEPSAAIALAAVLTHPQRFAGRRVGVILSGGNLDLDTSSGLLSRAG